MERFRPGDEVVSILNKDCTYVVYSYQGDVCLICLHSANFDITNLDLSHPYQVHDWQYILKLKNPFLAYAKRAIKDSEIDPCQK